MLEVENLDLFYGDAQALDGVSLEVAAGRDRRHRRRQRRRQDLAHPHHRRHRAAGARTHPLRGTDIAGWPSHRVCDLGIGQVAEGRQVFPDADGAENLEMGALLPRARRALRATSSASSPCSRAWPSAAARRPARCRAASSRCWRSAAA